MIEVSAGRRADSAEPGKSENVYLTCDTSLPAKHWLRFRASPRNLFHRAQSTGSFFSASPQASCVLTIDLPSSLGRLI